MGDQNKVIHIEHGGSTNNNTEPPYDVIIQDDDQPEIFIFQNQQKMSNNKIIKFNLIDKSQTDYHISSQMWYYLSATIFQPVGLYPNIHIQAVIKKVFNETTNNTKYILLILSIPQQIIYRISLEQNEVTSLGRSNIMYHTTPLQPYLRILKLQISQNNNKLYGVAIDSRDYSIYNVIVEDWRYIDVSKVTIDKYIMKGNNNFYLFRSDNGLKQDVQQIEMVCTCPQKLMYFAVTKKKQYLLIWQDRFLMHLITLNYNENKKVCPQILQKIKILPEYSEDQLETYNIDEQEQLTFYGKLIFFIPPLYDKNFVIGFIDLNVYEIYLYHVNTKRMKKCMNNRIKDDLRKYITDYDCQHKTDHWITVQIIDEPNKRKDVINNFIRQAMKSFEFNIPQIINTIVMTYYYIQTIYLSKHNYDIFSFEVDQLFM